MEKEEVSPKHIIALDRSKGWRMKQNFFVQPEKEKRKQDENEGRQGHCF